MKSLFLSFKVNNRVFFCFIRGQNDHSEEIPRPITSQIYLLAAPGHASWFCEKSGGLNIFLGTSCRIKPTDIRVNNKVIWDEDFHKTTDVTIHNLTYKNVRQLAEYLLSFCSQSGDLQQCRTSLLQFITNPPILAPNIDEYEEHHQVIKPKQGTGDQLLFDKALLKQYEIELQPQPLKPNSLYILIEFLQPHSYITGHSPGV